jgi:hypothetical protein
MKSAAGAATQYFNGTPNNMSEANDGTAVSVTASSCKRRAARRRSMARSKASSTRMTFLLELAAAMVEEEYVWDSDE